MEESKAKDIYVNSIPIMLDKERHIKYTFGAYGWLARKHGSVVAATKPLSDSENMKMLTTKSMGIIADLVYAGLLWEDENLDRDSIDDKETGKNKDRQRITDLLDFSELPKVIEIISQAINNSVPQGVSSDPTATPAV